MNDLNPTTFATALVLMSTATITTLAQDAVQWTEAEGGNGHWYQLRSVVGSWHACRDAAIEEGGELCCHGNPSEDQFIRALIPVEVPGGPWNRVHTGGKRTQEAGSKPQWTWVDGSPWSYTNWNPNEPDGNEDYLVVIKRENDVFGWDDHLVQSSEIVYFLIEWSADCNNDGIVDYGQILDGTLVDTDQNGVPDWCDSCTGDVNGDGTVDAADLGALLALWGTNGNSSPRADANRDGTVDAADLGLLLGYWGDCP